MDTTVYHHDEIKEAAKIIKQGGLISFPTETVYGLGADATNTEAVKKVYLAKGRPSDNPLIVHVNSKEMVEEYVDTIPDKALQLMKIFWPGPLTLIFNLAQNNNLSTSVTANLNTAAFRMPNNFVTLELIRQSATPLVGPSANTSGKPSPTTAIHVLNDLSGKIEGILDDGECEVGIESTVLDMSNPNMPTILRPGAITKEEIEEVIGEIAIDTHLIDEHNAPKSPGMKYKHYSPDTPVVMIDSELDNWEEAVEYYQQLNKTVAILSNKEIVSRLVDYSVFAHYILSDKKDVKSAMHHLFGGLRALDAELLGYNGVILAEGYPEVSQNMGYMNRLKKAANQTFFRK